jgi:hypothetical protein
MEMERRSHGHDGNETFVSTFNHADTIWSEQLFLSWKIFSSRRSPGVADVLDSLHRF